MEKYAESAMVILDELHTERLDYRSEYLPLASAIQRLAAYEDTGLEPEEIPTGLELANVYGAMLLLKRYQALGVVEELAALVKARDEHKAYKLDGFYCDICEKKHLRVVEINGIYFTRAEAETALEGGVQT